MVKKTVYAVLVLALAGLCFAGQGNKLSAVPTADIDFDVDVTVWWQSHPFNPEGDNYTPEIESPEYEVTLSAGDCIDKAINDLPESGGTIILEKGTYAGNWSIVGKNNVHIIAPQGAVVDMTKENSDVKWRIPIAGCELSLDSSKYNALFREDRDPAALECWNNGIKNIYIKGITFDGGGKHEAAFMVKTCDGVMFEKCTFQNFRNPGYGHRGMIHSNTGADSVWIRDCHFVGSQQWAVCLDGLYGGGLINCTIEEHYTNGILFLCNEDYSKDFEETGNFTKKERRNTQYAVVYGNTFKGGLLTCVSATGNDILIRNNKVESWVYSFTHFNPKTSLINRNLVHYCYDFFIENNTTASLEMFAHFNTALDDKFDDWDNKSKLGRYTIRGNRINGSFTHTVEHTGQVDGPNVVGGNCWNESDCVTNDSYGK